MDLNTTISNIIDTKTKPLGSLGMLEEIAHKICMIQNTTSPKLLLPHHILFAADHGISSSGVSAYPAEVTTQMVNNILNGGAAINVFCRQHDIELITVDAGVNNDFPQSNNLVSQKINYGTQNFLHTPAMSSDELDQCFEYGKNLIKSIHSKGCNIIGFGEMGIGNTSSASIIMHKICDIPLDECIGKGTGLNTDQLMIKKRILAQANRAHINIKDPKTILQTFGGFEIAQMCAAMIAAYEHQMIILIDGFISTSALLVAHALYPNILDNAIFTHVSDEKGHKIMLDFLNEHPILQLNLRLGEGIGCALVYPLVESAVRFINEMSSFEKSGISSVL